MFPFPCVYHRFRSRLSTYQPNTFRGRQKKPHLKPPPPQQVVVILLCICFIMVWSCAIALGLTKTAVALFSSDLFMKSKGSLQMHEGVFPSSVFSPLNTFVLFTYKYIDLFTSFSIFCFVITNHFYIALFSALEQIHRSSCFLVHAKLFECFHSLCFICFFSAC